jgi:hypothetical protein
MLETHRRQCQSQDTQVTCLPAAPWSVIISNHSLLRSLHSSDSLVLLMDRCSGMSLSLKLLRNHSLFTPGTNYASSLVYQIRAVFPHFYILSVIPLGNWGAPHPKASNTAFLKLNIRIRSNATTICTTLARFNPQYTHTHTHTT